MHGEKVMTLAQRVNRYIEQEFTGPCQWAVFPDGIIVIFMPPELIRQTDISFRARDILHGYGIERDTYDSIKPLQDGGHLGDVGRATTHGRGVLPWRSRRP